ncbi:TonB-dependent receptor [Synoicihabitans lomoniglobus]|uniref:TonB-dependent receptor n=1 Tax=Synoicihabitans lomoniglobus TaxID=2909285 RepID=UPI002ED3FEAD|nr:TonB-dependent receptor [Opitutaceae bacterium LMO-M01]
MIVLWAGGDRVRAQQSPVIDGSSRMGGEVSGAFLGARDDGVVPKLRVRVVETGAEVMTGETGEFLLTDVPPGVYTLRVSGVGYAEVEVTDVVVLPGERRTLIPQRVPTFRRHGDVSTLSLVTINAQRLRGMDEAMETFERATVTGSHLKRIGSSAFSLHRIERVELEQRSAITPALLLATVPEVTGLPLNVSSVAGTSARGDNMAISLRGLGSGNTLMLLNGRRLVAHPIAPIDEYSVPTLTVNVNQLPMHGFGEIDILRGGASSTYGFDAVAGLVDYRMNTAFRGEELGIQIGVPEAGGGEDIATHWMHGRDFADGRGRWVMVLDAYRREPIFLRDRDYAAQADQSDRAPPPFNVAGSAFDDATRTGYYPSFRVGASNHTQYFRPLADAGTVPQITGIRPTPDDGTNYFFNVNDYQTAFPETDRFNLFNSFEYDLTDQVTAFGELAGYKAISAVERQPIPYSGANGVDRPVELAVDNPFNPFGSRYYETSGQPNADGTSRLVGTPQPLHLLTQAVVDAGAEHIDINSQVFRALAGLRGDLSSGWTWETGLLFSAARTADRSVNQVRESLLQAATQRTDATAYNPFGYTFKVENGAVVADQPYTNPAAVMDTILSPFLRKGHSSLAIVDARATGDVALGRDRTMGLAVGAEFRVESYEDWRMPFAGLNPVDSGLDPNDNDFIQASPTADTKAHRNVQALYAETVIPLIERDAINEAPPLVELALAARYERHDDFGDELAPRFGLSWWCGSKLQVHASLDRSFRAPNLALLHAVPKVRVQTGVSDDYRRAVTGEGTGSVNLLYGGNSGLQPEEATGINVGFIAELPGLEDLTLKVDYWSTEQTNVIGSDSGPEVVLNDTRLLNEYVQTQLAAGVPAAQIHLGSGTAAYRGDARVVRRPVSAQDRTIFDQYNAAVDPADQRPVIGVIDWIERPFTNNRSGFASGVDVGLDYQLAAPGWGRFSLSTNAAYSISSYLQEDEDLYRDHRRDEEGGQRLRLTSTLGWQRGGWRATLIGYYISSYQDRSATTTEEVYEALGRPGYIRPSIDQGRTVYRYVVDATLSFDCALSYQFSHADISAWWAGTTLRLKVANLTDQDPPLTSATRGFSMNAHARLVAGRTWALDITRRF